MDWYWLSLIPVPILAWLWFELARGEAPPIPLPRNTIRKMLTLAKVRRNDVVYDLGSGDARILCVSAKEFDAESVGIEKNRLLVWLSSWIINKNDLQDKIKVIHGDIFKENIEDADIVLMYLSHKLTQKLRSKFEKELKKGTRIVSASHPVVGWKEIRKLRTGHFYSYLYKI